LCRAGGHLFQRFLFKAAKDESTSAFKSNVEATRAHFRSRSLHLRRSESSPGAQLIEYGEKTKIGIVDRYFFENRSSPNSLVDFAAESKARGIHGPGGSQTLSGKLMIWRDNAPSVSQKFPASTACGCSPPQVCPKTGTAVFLFLLFPILLKAPNF